MYRLILLFFLLLAIGSANALPALPSWENLPPTPILPKANKSGYASINGVQIWYAIFGSGKPIILLHGALANSNYWGNQIPALAKKYTVITMDSRGQGRSSHNNEPYSYDLMASDVIGLMDFLKIKQAAIIGWSDGAIIGLNIAINHPKRISHLFAFGANSNPNGIYDISNVTIFNTFLARAKIEYEQLSPTPTEYNLLLEKLQKMMTNQPNFSKQQLNSIQVPIWIVDGDHDEGIRREDTEFMAAQIPNAGLLLLPNVNHFAFIQDPKLFTDSALHFLAQ